MEPAKAHDCGHFLLSAHDAQIWTWGTQLQPPEESDAVNIVLPQRPALSAHGLHLQVHIAISEPHMGAAAWQSWGPIEIPSFWGDWNHSFHKKDSEE